MFATPLGLLGLLAVPAVLALHWFRRRFRPAQVSALFLWEANERTPLSGRKRTRLLRSASLWLELLIALALGLALGGPRACGAGEAPHLVVVLDDSASMGARPDDGAPLAERARDEVRRRIDRLPGSARVSLIASGPRPRLVAGPAAFPAEAEAALDTFEPQALTHSLAPAVALAQGIAGDGAVLVVTDRFEPDDFPAEVELLSIGAPADNVAIAHATRVRRSGSDADGVLLAVANLSARPARRTLELVEGEFVENELVDGELVEGERVHAAEALELAPGERRQLALELPAGAGPVEARLAPDALAADDHAFLAPPPRRVLALAATLGGESAHRLGLASAPDAGSAIDRFLALVEDSVAATEPELADVLVARKAPATAAVAGKSPWVLALDAPGTERLDLLGPFLVERGHPLLDGVTLDGVVWSAAPGVRLPGTPLVSAEELALVTLAVEPGGTGRRVVHLNLDERRSTLARSPDWPILLANVCALARDELSGPRRTNLHAGEPFTWIGTGAGEYTLDGPGGRSVHPARTDLHLDAPAQPGLYALEHAGEHLAWLGVSFADAAESDLRGLRPGHRPASGTRAALRAGFTPIEVLLVLGAALCAALDWWVLARAAARED